MFQISVQKKLLAKLFEKHLYKLVSDVGLFTRCNTRLIGKEEPNPVPYWEKKDKLDKYQLPLGRLETYNTWNFTVTRWVPNSKRMERLQKKYRDHYKKTYTRELMIVQENGSTL